MPDPAPPSPPAPPPPPPPVVRTASGNGVYGTISLGTAIDNLVGRDGQGRVRSRESRFAQGLANLRITQRSDPKNAAIIVDAVVDTVEYNFGNVQGTDIPKIVLVGGSTVDIKLADDILSQILTSQDFRQYLGRVGRGFPDANGNFTNPNSTVFFLLSNISDISKSVGGQAQSDITASNRDGEYENYVASTRQTGTETDNASRFRRFTFVQSFIHELYHFSDAHPAFPPLSPPTSQVTLDSLVNISDSDIRRTYQSDNTYTESNRILLNLFKKDYRDFGFDTQKEFEDQVNSSGESSTVAFYSQRRRDVLVWVFDSIISGSSTVSFTQAQLEALDDDDIIKLKRNGNPANPRDYEVESSARANANTAKLADDQKNAAISSSIARLEAELGQITPPSADDEADTPGNESPLAVYNSVYADVVARRAREAAGDVGRVFGSTLGKYIGKGDVFTEIIAGSILGTITENIAEIISVGGFVHKLPSNSTQSVVADFGTEFLDNLKSAGIGALSSFLTAELVNALGIDGLAGEFVSTGAGAVIGQVITNIVDGANLFNGVNPLLIANAFGSFVGSKLAQQVISFDTIGGQLGSSIGSAIGGLVAGKILGDSLAALGAAAGPVGIAIGAFVGFIIGGLIGSLFGGTPRSGADVSWNYGEGRFSVSNVYSRKGGSKETARALAKSVADTFNYVLDITGGTLIQPQNVNTGNYGMRKSDLVYRPASTQDKDAITYRVSSKDKNGFAKITSYGIFNGLIDPNFKLVGGDVYTKRALYATIKGYSAHDLDLNTLVGNLSTGADYSKFVSDKFVIQSIISKDPSSSFSVGWLLTTTRAYELGINRRAESDWHGGWAQFQKELGISITQIDNKLVFDDTLNKPVRYSAIFDERDNYLYHVDDTVLGSETTAILADGSSQTVDLRSGSLSNQIGYTVNGHLNNDIAVSGQDFTAHSATPISFAPTALRTQAIVTGLGDATASEAAEKFLGQLSNGTGVSIIGG